MKTKVLLFCLLLTVGPLTAENYLRTVNVTVSGTLSSLISFQYPNLNAGHYSLQTIILPDNLTSVGKFAFAYCSALKGTVKIPDSVTVIGERAFYYCDNLAGLTLGNSLIDIAAGAFFAI